MVVVSKGRPGTVRFGDMAMELTWGSHGCFVRLFCFGPVFVCMSRKVDTLTKGRYNYAVEDVVDEGQEGRKKPEGISFEVDA